MRYNITTKEPMLIVAAMELTGDYSTLSFIKIDDYHAVVECDGILTGIIGYTCQIEDAIS